MTLLDRIVVPVAGERDAAATATALTPYLESIQHVTAVHVIEKGGGVVDKAPMEKRRADAKAYLSAVESRLGDEVELETRIVFGTDVAETIVETALEVDATAIAFHPRGSNRLIRFLSGDTAARLVGDSRIPIVSIHAMDEFHSPAVRGRTHSDGTEASR